MKNKLRFMKKVQQFNRDEQGVTLIEVLAGLMIIGMIASILYGFMLMGMTMYKKITIETQLRNQANLMLGFVMDEMRDAIYAEPIYNEDHTQNTSQILLVKRGTDSAIDETQYVEEHIIEIREKEILSYPKTSSEKGSLRRLTGQQMNMSGSFEIVNHRLVNIQLDFTDQLDLLNPNITEANLTIKRKVPLFRIE